MAELAGLSSAVAAERLLHDGPNVLVQEKAAGPWRILLAQFRSPMIWLLLAAAVVSGVLGEVADAIAIGAIVLLNGGVGFFQEYKAENAIMALRAMTAPRARVMRDGHSCIVPARDIVVGDTLVLEAGDVVAADAHVSEAHHFTTNDAALTGESLPVEKAATQPVFLGTAVASGTALAVVFATAMASELGRIAHLLATTEDEDTPLERRLQSVSKTLLFVCLGVVTVVAVLGIVRGNPWLEVLVFAVSLAVAAVPEGMPAIVTIALALGVQRMSARHVLVRRLPAVETLGCTTVICTDKTGTLTTGVMAVREVWSDDTRGMLDAAAACCDAELATRLGDSTEVAILAEAQKVGILREEIERSRARVHVYPFESARRRMSILRADGVLYVKGAVEEICARCVGDMTQAQLANERMAGRGLRVLAIATGRGEAEHGWTLRGLIGIADAPREEAITAIRDAKAAGIRTVMITGDHPVTANAIARELGLDADCVHARATAESKLQIVREWKRKGAIVAMTGDGVNDAPAIKEADIGIAMGKGGTEVTREAADMVLTDDNYASIVAAVREGRGIYDNIRKTVVYLLAGNTAELLVFLVAAIFALPLPLVPLQVLWVNLVTDGFPALALVTDPVDADTLQRPPRDPKEPILGKRQWLLVLGVGALEAAWVLIVYAWALKTHAFAEARTAAFLTLVSSELLRTFAARSEEKVLWQVGAFTNLRVVIVVAVSGAMQLVMMYVPWTARLFSVAPLPFSVLAVSVAAALVPVSVIELIKLVRGRRA